MKKNPNYAIALKVRKVEPNEKIDESVSKFYGKPCLPESLVNKYPDDSVFFCQIRCEDLKEFDVENRLPHEGYLYFFLDAEMYPSYDLYMLVEHTLEEPMYVIDDYNEQSPINEGLNDAYVITFELVDASYTQTKLLGCPSGYVDEYDDKPSLLLQYDPLDFDVPYLETIDGYSYVFYKKNKKGKITNIEYEVEYS